LLARFVADGDAEAFAELVRRLGPAMYAVCRRFLGDSPDTGDAFQATFLVLARKAAAIRPPGKVAAWLHGVAVLAARKARSVRARWEVTLAELPDWPAPEVAVSAELAPALNEELDRLPDRLRLPILLCELHERSVAEAAAELGWPVGTVASRLSRGRTLLAERLTRRGMATGALLLAGALSRAATATVPGRMVIAAVRVAGGSGPASDVVLSLASEVQRAMSHMKVRLLVVGVVAAVAAAAGLGVVPTSAAAPVPNLPAPPTATIDRVRLSDLSGSDARRPRQLLYPRLHGPRGWSWVNAPWDDGDTGAIKAVLIDTAARSR
jgi:RNA polymerase sigma-70 factor (ECF subfamily)